MVIFLISLPPFYDFLGNDRLVAEQNQPHYAFDEMGELKRKFASEDARPFGVQGAILVDQLLVIFVVLVPVLLVVVSKLVL